ncbi:ankyrin repeat domain-containing protein [Nonomuraea sp. NPDC059007]|uniref:ankyrin repeat domain-containing protein n=1 Tax=Nonomuraea sp. NPDC059007 TaxID=3346692 RepID=UPI00369E79E0
MPISRLPDHPSAEALRKQAKTLLRYVRAGVPEALAMVEEFHPRRPNAPKLADAQLVTARRHGFPSWGRLMKHLETVGRYTRSPHEVPAAADPAAEFLRVACLTYGDDYPGRLREADELLAADPALATANVFTMAATGSAAALRAALAADPSLATAQGGPFGWEPLLYLAYARLKRPGRYVEAARVLLDHGADPDAGFLWDGLPSPFTALTGAFGGGEGDQPPHQSGLELARVLLAAGADANDAQTVYNLGLAGSWSDDTAHLELLLEYGLGRGDGGPWRERLGHELASPAELLSEELATAALRGGPRRVRLLLEYGVPVDRPGGHPGFGGRTPYELALVHGHREVAGLLAAAGARRPELDELEAFAAACMSGDADAVAALGPEVLARALAETPGLMNRAAEHGRPDVVRLLAGLGFDVGHRERSTPLHLAAWNDDVDTVTALLELGADPSAEDDDHDSTPLGWAEYGGKRRVAAYLRMTYPGLM